MPTSSRAIPSQNREEQHHLRLDICRAFQEYSHDPSRPPPQTCQAGAVLIVALLLTRLGLRELRKLTLTAGSWVGGCLPSLSFLIFKTGTGMLGFQVCEDRV